MVTARAYLVSELEQNLPHGWRVIPTQRSLDAIEGKMPVVIVKQDQISKAPQLPHPAAGVYLVDYVVTVLSPHQDFDRAEIQLDNGILRLIDALARSGNVKWTSAKKVTDGGPQNDRYLGYDLTIQVLDQQGATQ
jgi:hypothetical protein